MFSAFCACTLWDSLHTMGVLCPIPTSSVQFVLRYLKPRSPCIITVLLGLSKVYWQDLCFTLPPLCSLLSLLLRWYFGLTHGGNAFFCNHRPSGVWVGGGMVTGALLLFPPVQQQLAGLWGKLPRAWEKKKTRQDMIGWTAWVVRLF